MRFSGPRPTQLLHEESFQMDDPTMQKDLFAKSLFECLILSDHRGLAGINLCLGKLGSHGRADIRIHESTHSHPESRGPLSVKRAGYTCDRRPVRFLAVVDEVLPGSDTGPNRIAPILLEMQQVMSAVYADGITDQIDDY
ncbi:hypothetical protein E4U30_006796 [Claviceps sp. LM220 group G6]|nr:hypothetical protein E4U30_006796 [Claviceps sp. LM220 group G6]